MLDSTIVRGPPAGGQRKRGVEDQALGRSRSGLTTQIHMLADLLGRPLHLIVTAGQRGDVARAPALLDGQEGVAVIADKAYDSNALRALITGMGAEAVIPCNPGRKVAIPHDRLADKQRNPIERCFNLMKPFDVSSPDTIEEPSTSSASLTSPPP